MASVEFNYEGRNITIQCNNYDTIDKIIKQYLFKSHIDPYSVSFLYNGGLITNKNLTFDQLSNSYDKSRNKMNVLVTNSVSKSSLEFKFESSTGADESMKDYTKMAILFALQKYPDDNLRQCQLIQEKFEDQYGGSWNCCKFKVGLGAISSYFNNYDICIIYGDYKYIIFNIL